jgi:hypothetical protein
MLMFLNYRHHIVGSRRIGLVVVDWNVWVRLWACLLAGWLIGDYLINNGRSLKLISHLDLGPGLRMNGT